MATKNTKLNQEFLRQQRKRLEELQEQLLGGDVKRIANELASQKNSGDIAQREIDQGLHDADQRRISDVARAIQKIEEGTYGFSDLSGEPIPNARLEATPEAILTVQEEELREIKNRM